MAHTLGDNVLVAHAFVSRDESMAYHAFDEGHLLAISVNAGLATLQIGASLVKSGAYELLMREVSSDPGIERL